MDDFNTFPRIIIYAYFPVISCYQNYPKLMELDFCIYFPRTSVTYFTYFTSHNKLFPHKSQKYFHFTQSDVIHPVFRLMTNVMHSLMLCLTMLYLSLTKAPFHNEIPPWVKAGCIFILNQQWAIMHATVNYKMHHGNEDWITFLIFLNWFE